MFGFPEPDVSVAPVAACGEHASIKKNPYDGPDAPVVDSTAPSTGGAATCAETWLAAHETARLHEILKQDFASVRVLLATLQKKRGFRILRNNSVPVADMDALVVSAVQIAHSAFHDKPDDEDDAEFLIEGYYTRTPSVAWRGDDELTNIESTFVFKGTKMCVSFIDHAGSFYASVYPLSER